MGFLRKKDRPYEVPEEVAGARSEIDDFRARLRRQVGGEQAKVNPELAKLKDQYDSRFTEDIAGRAGEGESEDEGRDPRQKEIESLMEGGDFNPYVSKSSFASPDDTTPSAEVPGLESRARPPTKPAAGESQAQGSGEFQCEDCATGYKELWTTCPKCGGKVAKMGVDPEVARLQAEAEQGPGGVRQVDPGASLSGLDSSLHSEFGRDEVGGTKPADDLLADLTDLSPGGAEAPAPAAEGFNCNSCGTEYKEKWGKCPKCGGTVERSKAPAEVSRMEARHQAIEGMEPAPPSAPSAPSAPTPSSGSSMLDDLLGTAPTPPEEPPTPSGASDLPDLVAPPEAPTPSSSPAPSPGGGLEDLTDSSGSAEFKASEELPSTMGAEPGAGMDDLLGGLDLPDEEEPPTPEAAAQEGEHELTPQEVGIRQAELSTDFSYGKPKRAAATKKVRRKSAGTGDRAVQAKRPPKAKAGARPKAAPRRTARQRPKPKARAPPPIVGPPSRPAPPPPEELKSDLLELIKQPSNHERKR